ncbi:hypothetical protein AB0E75_33330 [Streptomyces griseoviridis]|uniref:Uncharacterized protein n=1 Tax=Streptomyces griseoviridis TaxID=45398 RepID=A0A918LGN6_STRGD|nr:hypothetical protein [Streptomyces niveoruber]GGS44955.1 hypothetical protein GCM10010238_38360 [Streptomyces niveoruber]
MIPGRAVLVASPRFRLTGRPDRGSTPGQATVEQWDPDADPDRRNPLRLTGDSGLGHVLALVLGVAFGRSGEEAAADDPERDRDRRVLRTREPAVFPSRSLDDRRPEGTSTGC